MLVYAVSLRREFRADSGAADLVGNRKMIAALKRLHAGSKQAPLPQSLAAMGISGNTRSGFARLFMTHPPIEERIAALEQYVAPLPPDLTLLRDVPVEQGLARAFPRGARVDTSVRRARSRSGCCPRGRW